MVLLTPRTTASTRPLPPPAKRKPARFLRPRLLLQKDAGPGTICVIVPPVENPFFGAMQEIAANKAEELGYTTLR